MLALKTALKSGSLRTLKNRKGLIDLTSNDYLGLARDPTFQRAVIERWEYWSGFVSQKVGSTGSRLLTGNHRYFEETEEKIAHLHGFQAATLFNCGYMANLALLSSVCKKEDALIADLCVHASLHDGMRLCGAKTLYFRHNDLTHLEMRLRRSHGRCFVIVESLYSMSGDKAPLAQIAELCAKFGAHLIVDEAHAIGILGRRGEGLVSDLGLQEKVFACMGAFGKALGAHGAVLLGSRLLKRSLINFARPFIYTTALPLSTLAAISCSYDRFPHMEAQREHLLHLCNYFSFPSPIHPIPLQGIARTKLASHCLASKGFDVRPIHTPTVPKGRECLRLVVHAFNTIEEIEQCLTQLIPWRTL
jgi:8-amino-7-oxononanoate synthase